MQRNTASFSVTDKDNFKQQILNWCSHFDICCFLDNNQYSSNHHSYEWLLAVDAVSLFSPKQNILEGLQQYCNEHNDWLFGHIGYDLKNETELLSSHHPDFIQFPDIFLFQPATVICCQQEKIFISSAVDAPHAVYEQIIAAAPAQQQAVKDISVKPRFTKRDYIETIENLRRHILRGDCYEINFCMEFFAENVLPDPLSTYNRLTEISPNPFSCFYKLHDKYLLCASPERYIRKEGSSIISQPIKGTIKRNESLLQDELNKQRLQQSNKERSENVMVVDLVRNDLSKVCKNGSVYVDELFGIYSFPQLHQMISTVKGELKDDIGLAEILKATFPMGSMTGAPKKRVMELIEQYERSKRGIFSGAVGYIAPNGDFDFNVVIRSIMHNQANKYLSYQVGSGITFYSNPTEEYEECLLKAKAIQQVLL